MQEQRGNVNKEKLEETIKKNSRNQNHCNTNEESF